VNSHSSAIRLGADTALLTVADTLPGAIAAGQAGATMIDVGDRGPELIAAIRGSVARMIVCGDDESADVVRDPALALRTGARLICADIAAAETAVGAGIARERILVTVPAAEVHAALRAGWATLTDVDASAATRGLAGAEAIAAVCAWLGATAVRTRHVAPIRRSLDMANSVLGTRPPAWAIRGLA
jgi:dihydropteroate synthase